MDNLAAIVREEASATKKLLEQIELEQASSNYYGQLLEKLKAMCEEVQKMTDEMSSYVTTPPNPNREEILKRWLVFGSYVIRQINSYCDNFENADLLAVPSATMQLLYKLLKKTTKSKAFLVKGSTEFIYAYRPIGHHLNELGSHLAESIPKLEDSFAVLKFPLAYSGNVMANCNLVHELGHLIVDNRELTKELDKILSSEKRIQIAEIIERHSRPEAGVQLSFQSARDRDEINRVIENWIHETLADFIAIQLIGPSALFAFLNHIEPMDSHKRDDEEHPCNSTRIKMFIEILHRMKWDQVIIDENPELWKRIIDISNEGRTSQKIFDAAAECLPLIKEEAFTVARKVCRNCTYRVETFQSTKDIIYGLFECGIPPAEQMRGEGKDSYFEGIDVVSILNVAWFFHGKGYPTWSQKFERVDATEKTEFLNRLLAKAMEITFVKEAASE